MKSPNTMQSLFTLLCAATLATAMVAGCAATVPQELATARTTYDRVSAGPAAQVSPAEVHKAAEALKEAERSFADDPESYRTRDLAYVAQRKAEIAESLAEAAMHQASVARYDAEYMAAQTGIVERTKEELGRSRADLAASERDGEKTSTQLTAEKQARAAADRRGAATDAQLAESERRGAVTDAQLAESERSGAATAAQLATEKTARSAADKRAADATRALAKLAAVKDEARGLVITLSGSVLFASDEAVLLPAAQARLGQVADALMAVKQRILVVEGHTDSRGSASHNTELSMRRADAVRSFLISKGYDPTLVSAQGIGQSRPIAKNTTAAGRANNRRVEIVVAPERPHQG